MFSLPLLPLAFGFASLPMLGWLAAAAAPVLIHLWNKRKYRETSWAAMEFLLAAVRRNARRIQLRQWLLLAVRTLLILCVVLAAAEPYLETLGVTFVAGQRSHKVIVLDGSYSMGYKPTEHTLFARAQELASSIVKESPQGDGFTLVLLGSPPRVVIGTPTLDAAGMETEIRGLTMPQTPGDLAATAAEVRRILARADEEFPEFQNREVYWLTDLGRNTWAGHSTQGNALAARQIEALAEQATLTVLDLGQAESDNVALVNVSTVEPFATLWRDVTIEAQVKNFGQTPKLRHLVELFVDGTRVKEAYVDLDAGDEATVSFSYRFETPGFHAIEVKLAADLLEADNTRWLSLEVKNQLKTLAVGGHSGATRYLVDALDPTRSERSLTQPQVVAESALVELDLDQFDAIFLCNIAQFTAGEAKLLDAYVKQGGGLVFFLGNQVLAERYNRELAGDSPEDIHLLPAKLGAVAPESQYRFDPLEYRHPLVTPFRGRERAGLLTTPIYRFIQLDIPAAWKQSRVALAFTDGSPAIVEAPHGRGRVVVVATDVSLPAANSASGNAWSALAAWPSFVPLAQELLSLAVGSQQKQFNVLVGESFGLPAPSAAVGGNVVILPPADTEDAQRQIALNVQNDGQSSRWSFAGTDQFGSGVYRAALPPPAAVEIPFAVNVDASSGRENSESNLIKAEPEELPPGFTVQTSWQDPDKDSAGAVSRRRGLQRSLLAAAFLLAAVELVMAWHFHRGVG